MRWTRSLPLAGLTALVVWSTAGPAYAAPITFTATEKISESFSDEPFLCQDELYKISGTGHVVTHLTARVDANGNIVPPLRFHLAEHATIVAVPLDGTGTSYVGHFHNSDSETIRSVKDGAMIVETDTDHNKVVAKGSDGSRVMFQEDHHFTVNANGDVTIEFERLKFSC